MAVEILTTDYPHGSLESSDVVPIKSSGFEAGRPVQSPEESVDGSFKTNGSGSGEMHMSADMLPKDAVDEWPADKEIHTFYFVKFRYYEDPKLKSKIELAENELQKRNQARYQLNELFKAKKSERFAIIDKLKPLTSQRKDFKKALDEKRKLMEPLQQALGKLRNSGNIDREKGIGLCSSEEELNERIQSLQYRIQHESNTLAEEKQLLKEIKQLEGSREKVIAHADMQAKIQDSFGQKEVIQDNVKSIGGDMDGVRKERQAVDVKIKSLEDDLKVADKEISALQEELKTASERRDKAYETLVELRKQRDDGNASYFQYRSLQTRFKDLAAKKDKSALEELSHAEMEKFLALWNSSKKTRDDYEKKILSSLDSRQLSRDGRMRNPNEKPLVSDEPPAAESKMGIKAAPEKSATKHSKDAVHPLVQHDPPINDTAQSQPAEKKKPNEADRKAKSIVLEEPEFFSVAETRSANKEVDAEKLKEMKRQEEIAKAKLALERKKKLAEKTAAKAAVRAQKEAEKKEKEREKKAKKKAGVTTNTESGDMAEDSPVTATAPENDDEKVEPESPVPIKQSISKENIRFRHRAKGGPQPVPKSLLKKKQATSYWLWLVPSAVLAVVLLLLLVYFYFLQKKPQN